MENIDSNENLIRLMHKYQNLIFSICLKMVGDYFTAEDLAQETFLSAYRHMHEFDGTAEKAWLCRIASNLCIDYLRGSERRSLPTAPEELPESGSGEESEPLKLCMNQELMTRFARSCWELPSPYREAAIGHYLEGKTARKLAEQRGISLKTCQTHIYRAREMLKKTMRKELMDE